MEDLNVVSKSRALLICSKTTAIASTIALFVAIQRIVTNKRRRKFMYNRLFVGYAIYSMLYTISLFMGTWAIPETYEGYLWNIGNEDSCSVQAFLSQMSTGSCFYIAFVCFSVALGIRFDFKEESYGHFEPIVHAICASIPFIMGTVMVARGLVHPEEITCTFASYHLCDDTEYNLSFPTRCKAVGQPTSWFKRVSITYSSVFKMLLPGGLAFCIIFVIIGFEIRKRIANKNLNGKRLFLENARRKASKRQFILAISHFTVTFVPLLCCHIKMWAPDLDKRTKSHLTFFHFVYSSISGLLNVLVHFYLPLSNRGSREADLINKFSIRSIRALNQIQEISFGYEPSTKESKIVDSHNEDPNNFFDSKDLTDFGIFIGSASDDGYDDDYNDIHDDEERCRHDSCNSKTISFDTEVKEITTALSYEENCEENQCLR